MSIDKICKSSLADFNQSVDPERSWLPNQARAKRTWRSSTCKPVAFIHTIAAIRVSRCCEPIANRPPTTTIQTSDEEGLGIKSHFVVRYKKECGNSPWMSDAVDWLLTDEDRAAGLISDRAGT